MILTINNVVGEDIVFQEPISPWMLINNNRNNNSKFWFGVHCNKAKIKLRKVIISVRPEPRRVKKWHEPRSLYDVTYWVKNIQRTISPPCTITMKAHCHPSAHNRVFYGGSRSRSLACGGPQNIGLLKPSTRVSLVGNFKSLNYSDSSAIVLVIKLWRKHSLLYW